MTEIVARPDESFESMYRRFKRAVERDGLLADLRKHEYFEKPSVKKKRKSAAAKKRDSKHRPRFVKTKNVNFKFSADKTEKIPTLPRRPQVRTPYRRPRKD